MQNENEKFSGVRFTDDRIVTEVNPSITIRGKVIATEQNIICISGLPKSRKTIFSWAFVSSYFKQIPVFDIQVYKKDQRPFLVIDTESGDYSFSKNIIHFKKRCNFKTIPEDLHIFLTRELDPTENLLLIKDLIEKIKPSYVLLDNITDICNNSLDPVESRKLVKELKKIASQYNCVIITIIHLSKSNNFTLGWLGSTIDRASQSVIKVVKDEETGSSTMEVDRLRDDSNFKPITIEYNEEIEDYQLSNEIYEKPGKFDILKADPQKYINIVSILFQHFQNVSYSDLVDQLKQLTSAGTNKVKTLIPLLINEGYLIQNKDRSYSKNPNIK